MEKYKVLKEYLKTCEEKNLQIKIINNLPVRIFTRYSQINSDLNALLKEWYDKQDDGWVTISNDSVINDKA